MTRRPTVASRSVLVGVGVVVERGERILLAKRAGGHASGTWSPPGGHLDYLEEPADCAQREALEETGVAIMQPALLIDVTVDPFEDVGRHYVTLWFEAQWADGEARIASAREVADVGWFHWEQLPQPLFPCFARLVDGHGLLGWRLPGERSRERDGARR